MGTNYKNWQMHMLNARSCGNRSAGSESNEKLGRKPGRTEISQEDVDICLNCTKEKCSGTNYCFNKQKTKK